MSRDRRRLTRDELYELVWKLPTQKLAMRFGLSDRGLAKACARMGVAVPARGHWARVTSGQEPVRPPLRPARTGEPQSVDIEELDDDEVSLLRTRTRRTPPIVPVKDSLAGVHPAVRALRALLPAAPRPRDGMFVVRGDWGYVLRVSPGTRDRALRCLDAVTAELERRNLKVEFAEGRGEDRRHPLRVMSGSEWVGLTRSCSATIEYSAVASRRTRRRKGSRQNIWAAFHASL
jgi:hypothetical protein